MQIGDKRLLSGKTGFPRFGNRRRGGDDSGFNQDDERVVDGVSKKSAPKNRMS